MVVHALERANALPRRPKPMNAVRDRRLRLRPQRATYRPPLLVQSGLPPSFRHACSSGLAGPLRLERPEVRASNPSSEQAPPDERGALRLCSSASLFNIYPKLGGHIGGCISISRSNNNRHEPKAVIVARSRSLCFLALLFFALVMVMVGIKTQSPRIAA